MKTPCKTVSYRGRSFHRGTQGRIQISNRLMGIKRSFDCGKPHMETKKHPSHEVTAAIKKFKDRHPTALLSIANLESVITIQDEKDDQGVYEHGEAYRVEWSEDWSGAGTVNITRITIGYDLTRATIGEFLIFSRHPCSDSKWGNDDAQKCIPY